MAEGRRGASLVRHGAVKAPEAVQGMVISTVASRTTGDLRRMGWSISTTGDLCRMGWGAFWLLSAWGNFLCGVREKFTHSFLRGDRQQYTGGGAAAPVAAHLWPMQSDSVSCTAVLLALIHTNVWLSDGVFVCVYSS